MTNQPNKEGQRQGGQTSSREQQRNEEGEFQGKKTAGRGTEIEPGERNLDEEIEGGVTDDENVADPRRGGQSNRGGSSGQSGGSSGQSGGSSGQSGRQDSGRSGQSGRGNQGSE